jgi:S-adenosyl methyltransferase
MNQHRCRPAPAPRHRPPAGAARLFPGTREHGRQPVTQSTPQDPAVGGQGRLPSFDAGVPNPARMWNYWLGGKDNVPAAPYNGRTPAYKHVT